MNVQEALSTISGTPTTKSILAAFKTGSNHPNFLSHPYTCNGKQMTGAPAICNDYYLMNQIKNGQLDPAEHDRLDHLEGLLPGLRARKAADSARPPRARAGRRASPTTTTDTDSCPATSSS